MSKYRTTLHISKILEYHVIGCIPAISPWIELPIALEDVEHIKKLKVDDLLYVTVDLDTRDVDEILASMVKISRRW